MMAAAPAAGPAPITDASQIWQLTNEERAQSHPLHIAGRVSYNDPGFNMLWLESNQGGTYLQLGDPSPVLRTGQYVVIEGKITPNTGLCGDDVTVRVVEENAPFTPLQTKGRINDFDALHGRIVTVEGYVDDQRFVDGDHIRLILIVENRPVICWIKPDDPKHVPNWQGSFVQATGLYSRRFDPSQTSASIELWLGRQEGLQVVDTLQKSAQFTRAVTPIGELYRTPLDTRVLVRGRIVKHDVGKAMTVRDATGQVDVISIQQQRLPLGTEVEAVGQVDLSSGKWVLDTALYRAVQATAAEIIPESPASPGVLTTVAQIRMLGAEEAAQGRPVEVVGMVVWVLPESPFLYLQDLTGGIRVYLDQSKTGPIRYGKYLRVKGVTRAGRVAPAVELRDLTDLGSMSHPPAKHITLEQALTGKEEGEWVELRGFAQGTVSEGDWRWIHVTTPAGDFTGLLQNPVSFVANPGSLIRVHGVCETTLDAEGHPQGIILRVPFIHDITVEEDAPADYYALPRRPVGDLGQISTSQDMLRVRVTGTVQYAIPGRLVYLEEDHKGVLLLTHEDQPLQPGDRIEAVGILGREGARAILRQAVYRKTGVAPVPEPLPIADARQVVPAADSRLARLRGILIDRVVFGHLGQTRLTLQQGSMLFEATLEQSAAAPPLAPAIGSGLEVTGIYQLKFDDARQARGFQLQLRSPDDVVIYMKPRLWTLQRALMVAGFLGGCLLLGLAWIRSLRQQVRQQTTQLRNQLEHQARLEAEVQRAARLESLGVLAGGMAHDYNNLLTVIMGNLSLMKFTPEVMALEGERVEDIEKSALRARDLTRQLLTFAEGTEPLRAAVDLAGLVRETTEPIVRGTDIRCGYEVAADLLPAFVDRDQIIQVVQNLVRNALEAMPHGGALRMVLANEEITAGYNARLKPGRYVRLACIDSGVGIAPDVLPQIFDPYFSTKENGGGLGLATGYSIVKKHQGHIEAQSRHGHGASFILWFPVAETSSANAQTELPLTPTPPPAFATSPRDATPLRVLLMDDEASIRKLGTIMLQRMELEVVAVADGASALREFEAARTGGRPFALLILDLTIMGGLGGKDTIAIIRRSDPDVPAIVSSGYSRDPVMARCRDYGFHAVIPKPYDIKRFKNTVQGLLQNNRGKA
jgi:signal transduction histidine kinase/CheY-like chemotaxis protein